MKFLFVLIGLLWGFETAKGQVFVITKAMVYRGDAIRSKKSEIKLYRVDTLNKQAEVSHVLGPKDGVELILFPNEKIRDQFAAGSDIYGITYKVLDPMPDLLRDSVFTGPRHLSLISNYFSLDIRQSTDLDPAKLGIDNSLVRAAYDLERFRKQSMVGIRVAIASSAVGLLALTDTQERSTFTAISVTGVLLGQLIWIDAYKHLGRASIGIDETGRQLKLKLGL